MVGADQGGGHGAAHGGVHVSKNEGGTQGGMGVSLLGEPVGCAPRLLPLLVPALRHSPSKALPPPIRPGDPQVCCWSHKPLVHSIPGAQFQPSIYFCHQTPPNNFGWCLCPHTAWQFPGPPHPISPRTPQLFWTPPMSPSPHLLPPCPQHPPMPWCLTGTPTPTASPTPLQVPVPRLRQPQLLPSYCPAASDPPRQLIPPAPP